MGYALPVYKRRQIVVYTQVDLCDYERFKNEHIFLSDQGYAKIVQRDASGKRHNLFLHRLIVDASKGVPVDHRNHDTLDNRRENLRLCSSAQNAQNRRRDIRNTSGVSGVCWNREKERWQAYIMAGGKRILIGRFEMLDDAAAARKAAAKEYHGEFASAA